MAGFFIEDLLTRAPDPGDADQNRQMLRYRPDPKQHPVIPGGEEWLFSEQQQLVCQFMPDTPSIHAQWVAVRTFSWVPPHPPVPQTLRRMLRHNAIEAWQTMLKTGCKRCNPPVR